MGGGGNLKQQASTVSLLPVGEAEAVTAVCREIRQPVIFFL
jgi:hypothetical protein